MDATTQVVLVAILALVVLLMWRGLRDWRRR